MDQGSGGAAHQTTLELAAAPLEGDLQVIREQYTASRSLVASHRHWDIHEVAKGQTALFLQTVSCCSLCA
jgi:2-oxoglutarate dehydrogenase complex dehydrogenase (E1) component-like enzyme